MSRLFWLSFSLNTAYYIYLFFQHTPSFLQIVLLRFSLKSQIPFRDRIHVPWCLFCLGVCEKSKNCRISCYHPGRSTRDLWPPNPPPILPHPLIECACDANRKSQSGKWQWQPAMESRVSDGACRHCQVVSLRVVGFILLTFTRSPCLQI